jgi:hypothetical protein
MLHTATTETAFRFARTALLAARRELGGGSSKKISIDTVPSRRAE